MAEPSDAEVRALRDYIGNLTEHWLSKDQCRGALAAAYAVRETEQAGEAQEMGIWTAEENR